MKRSDLSIYTAIFAVTVFLILLLSSTCTAAWSEGEAEKKKRIAAELKDKIKAETSDNDKIKCSVKHHNMYVSNMLSGPGASSATSFDMTIYEAGLFRRVEYGNDSLISPNLSFPIGGTSAFTSNTWLKCDARCTSSLSTGATLRAYTMADNDKGGATPGTPMSRLARSYGVMPPIASFTAVVPGSYIIPDIPFPASYLSLSRFYLEGKGNKSRWTLEGGELYPTMGKPYNKYLNMEHFLFRTPISQPSVLGHWKKQDALFSEALPLERMPGYGVKYSGETGKMNYELFSLKNGEMPNALNREFDYSGARAGYSDKKVRCAASAITSHRKTIRVEETPGLPMNRQESLLGLEAEYDLSPSIGLYSALTSSSYCEDGARSGLGFIGSSQLYGIHGAFFNRSLQADLRYQYLDPDYEPLTHTKKAVYPSNYQGFRYELKYSWASTEREKKKGKNMVAVHGCSLSQIDGNINLRAEGGFNHFAAADYIFPDGGSRWVNNSTKGTVNVFSPELCISLRKTPFEVGGYYERLQMTRGIDASCRSYDKRVDNLSLWMDYRINPTLELIFGIRRVDFKGHWYQKEKLYNFRQNASIPKLGISYDNDRDLKINAQMQFMNFTDNSPVNLGNGAASDNDWKSSLFFIETTITF
ncbi:MAG: hypothetical protein AB2L14_35925 [Candidatus Xenobiia bacterium LiM19]